MSVAVARPHDLPKLGVRSGARLRQWHLDLIMLASLTAAAPRLVPSPLRKAAVPVAVRAWVYASAFGVLAFRPDLKDQSVHRTSVAALLMAASEGFTGAAAAAGKRRLEER